jgi:hypothetical protein
MNEGKKWEDFGFSAEPEAQKPNEPTKPRTTHEQLLEAVGLLGRGADYLGGAHRAALGRFGSPFWRLPQTDPKRYTEALVSDQELKDAVTPGSGKGAPQTAELLRREGMGEGGHLSDLLPGLYEDPKPGQNDTVWPNKHGFLDPTGRGTLGFAGDVATDPWSAYGFVSAAPASAAEDAMEGAIQMAKKPRAGLARSRTTPRALSPDVERMAADGVTVTHANPDFAHALPGPGEQKQIPGPGLPEAQALPPGAEHMSPEEMAAAQHDQKYIEADLADAGLSEQPVAPRAQRRTMAIGGPGPVGSGPALAAPASRLQSAKEKLAAALLAAPGLAKQGLDLLAAPASKLTASRGNAMYEDALRPVLQFGKDRGKTDVADTLSRYGFWRMKNLEDIGDVTSKLKAGRDVFEKEAGRAGARVSLPAALEPSVQRIWSAVQRGALSQEEGRRLADDLIMRYAHVQDGVVAPSVSSELKTGVRKGLPTNYWNEMRQQNPTLVKQLKGALGDDFQVHTEEAVGRGLGEKAADTYSQMNADLGDLLTIKPAAIRHGRRELQQSLLPDAATAAAMGGEIAVRHEPPFGFGAWHLLKTSRLPRFKMPMGYALKRAGESPTFGPAMDAVIRRRLAEPPKEKKDGEE